MRFFFQIFPWGFRRKLDIFGKKSGGTPNPTVKKLGVTPNPDQNFASAAARRGGGRARREAPVPAGAAAAAADAKISSGLGVTPNFLTGGLGVHPFFLPKSRVFVAPSTPPHTHTHQIP